MKKILILFFIISFLVSNGQTKRPSELRKEKMEKELLKYYDAWQNGKQLSSGDIQQFTRRNLTQKLVTFLSFNAE